MPEPSNGFARRHPFLFGFLMLILAVALLVGAAALLRSCSTPSSSSRSGSSVNSLFGKSFGVVRVQGPIEVAEPTVNWINTLRDDDNVVGVVVRIDSPGGGVGPSQEIYQAVLRLAQEKPVVASMGAVAASGGYYVASPAKVIVANSSTITGSIGVIMQLSNFEKLMSKIGVSFTNITSGDYKDAGSPFKPLGKKQKEYLQALVMDMHAQFVEDVSTARGMDLEELRKLADGRVYTGRQALKVGLVDKIGTFDDAFVALAELTGTDSDLPWKEGPKEEEPSLMRELLKDAIDLGIVPSSRGSYTGPRWELTGS